MSLKLIMLLSSQKSPWCTVLGKQADWVRVKAYASGTLTRVTWRRAVEGLGWPLAPKTFHLALD